MYSILIVDDEFIERDGLRFLLQDDRYESLCLLEAANGEAALAILESNAVDILITDIRMPFMDGLTLARHARRRDPSIKILICTAHDEFEYAKEAIDLEVSGYLLKPIQREAFDRQMDKVLSACRLTAQSRQASEESRRMAREKCWFRLMHGHPLDERMQKRFMENDMDVDENIMLALCLFEQPFFTENADAFERAVANKAEGSWIMDVDRAILLLSLASEAQARAAGDDLRDYIQARFGVTPRIYIAVPKGGAQNLHKAYKQLDRQSDDLSVFPDGPALMDDCNAPQDEGAIERILSIVNERYDEDLTLDLLAGEVYMTPSYVSFMFKRKTGTTLIKHITNTRLQHAARLLRASGLKITDIAARVGYVNASYFGSIFKAHFGVSPAKYRQKHQEQAT